MATNNGKTNNKTTDLELDQKAVDGLAKYYAGSATLPLGGVPITPAALEATFQDDIDAQKALDAARAQLQPLLAKKVQTRAAARLRRKQLKAYILATEGERAAQMLQDFAIPVPKAPGRRSAVSKAKAAVQANATRALRRPNRAAKSPPVELQAVPVSATGAATTAPAMAPAMAPATAPAMAPAAPAVSPPAAPPATPKPAT